MITPAVIECQVIAGERSESLAAKQEGIPAFIAPPVVNTRILS